MRNALTFDVEDWYQGIELGPERWPEFERRLDLGLGRILDLLAEADVRGTFFVLGCCAREHPDLVRQIAQGGHEVASHGLSHTKVYDLTPTAFSAELAEAHKLLTDLADQPVIGHRAPYFSITERSLWALDILREQGYRYDASIYPGRNYRYGIPGAPDEPYRLDNGLAEQPVSVLKLRDRRLGIGGAYFRILPYCLTAGGIRAYNRRGLPAVFYLHPWEFDPRHPRVEFPRKAQLTHYWNLGATERRFRRLLREFRFATVAEVLSERGLLA